MLPVEFELNGFLRPADNWRCGLFCSVARDAVGVQKTLIVVEVGDIYLPNKNYGLSIVADSTYWAQPAMVVIIKRKYDN